uniref:Uncharacterized protein n=1 Tax=Bionectria ochroleuca TaxID=29856 RepID=A0A8H7TQX1_BIOOC
MARDERTISILADLAASLRRANGRDNQTIKFVADLAARLRQATGASAPPGGRNRHHRPKCWNCKNSAMCAPSVGPPRAAAAAKDAAPTPGPPPPPSEAAAEAALPAAEPSQ